MNIKKYIPIKKTPKTKHLQVRLTPQDFIDLSEALTREAISFQDFLEASCKAYIAQSLGKRKQLPSL